jgi:phosphoribosylaminoimidazolecarboxamide formyltransferase/IMP cyclohydrolase
MTKHALISVSDYAGLTKLARKLVALGFTLVASLGNAIYLEKQHVKVTRIQTITKYSPMMMPNGIKSIHHLVFAGILADRNNEEHMMEVDKYHITTFDVVVCNFYPFQRMASRHAPDKAIMQNIDIGGPAMVRCAAKNYRNVIIVTDPHDYDSVLTALEKGKTISVDARRELAVKAFKLTKSYDDGIVTYLSRRTVS